MREVFKLKDGRLTPVASSAVDLRAYFGLGSRAKVIVVGVAKDEHLERYWEGAERDSCAEALGELGVELAVTPNFSMFLNEPRTQHMFNRKRILLAAQEWATVGIAAVPVLQSVCAEDWRYWERFLSEHTEVHVVALEFQTGLARPERGVRAIRALAAVGENVGRHLHLMAIGGAQFSAEISSQFGAWTILDSTPFMKAVHRQVAYRYGGHLKWRRDGDRRLDEILAINIEKQTEEIRRRAMLVDTLPSAA